MGRSKGKYLSIQSSRKFLKRVDRLAQEKNVKTFTFIGVPRATYYRWRKKEEVPETKALEISARLGLCYRDFVTKATEFDSALVKRSSMFTEMVRLFQNYALKGFADDLHICVIRILSLIQQRFWELGWPSLLNSVRSVEASDKFLVVAIAGNDTDFRIRVSRDKHYKPKISLYDADNNLLVGGEFSPKGLTSLISRIRDAVDKEELKQTEVDQQARLMLYHQSK